MNWLRIPGVLLAALSLQGQVSIEPRARHVTSIAAETVHNAANLRVDSSLVLVPITVCDPMNKPITGLDREHFRIFDDKVEQEVTHFAMDDQPLAVGVVFDMSGSMGPKLRRSRSAVAEFFKQANAEDEFFLVEFNDKPKLVTPLTRDTQEIQTQLATAQSKGRTALLDALMLALHEMKKSKLSRKAILLLSDGGDNASRYTEAEVRNAVQESDVMVYSLGIFESHGSRKSPEEAQGPALLNELAEATGGRAFTVEDLAELPDMAAKIGIELRNRYVIGYSPKDRQRDGRYHRVEVKMVPPPGLPKLHAYWRPGYYAPGD